MKNLLTKTISIVFSVLLVLPLFTAWTMFSSTGVEAEGVGINDTNILGKLFYEGSDSEALMTISRILYYVVLGLAAVLIVLLIVQLLMKKGEKLNGIVKLVSVVLLVLAVLSFALNLTWGLINTESETVANVTLKMGFVPGFGAYALLVSGLLAGVFGLISANVKKRKR